MTIWLVAAALAAALTLNVWLLFRLAGRKPAPELEDSVVETGWTWPSPPAERPAAPDLAEPKPGVFNSVSVREH